MTKEIRRLSVVVPAYNEQDCIGECLERITRYLQPKPFDFEIIVVDDGSADRTREIVAELSALDPRLRLVQNETNRGKGSAVKKGVLAASGDYVLFMDADFSTPIKEFDKFQPHLENGATVVIGSRREAQSEITIPQPWYRVCMGQAFTLLARLLVAPPVHDFTCGFKCFAASTAQLIFSKQSLEDWSFDAEILHIAYKRGIEITHVPVFWENHPGSKVKIFESTIKAFWGLVKIRLNSRLGKY